MNVFMNEISRMAVAQFWQVTVVLLIVLSVVRVCYKRWPKVAHVLLLLAVMKAVTPPLIAVNWGVFDWSWGGTGSEIVAAEPVEMSVDLTREDLAVPVEVDQPERHVARQIDSQQFAWTWATFTLRDTILLTWLAGVLVLGSVIFLKWHWLVQKISASSREPDEWVIELLGDVSYQIGLRCRVRMLVSAAGYGPSSFGVFRPVIVLPDQLLRNGNRDELRMVLAHEAMHIRRCDGLAALLQSVAVVMWWFYPVIWMTSRQLTRVREQCCDLDVLRRTGCVPGEYAQGILQVLKVTAKLKPSFLESGLRSAELTEERLNMIMNRNCQSQAKSDWFAWTLFVVGMMICLPGGDSQAQNDARRRTEDWARLSPFSEVVVEGTDVEVVVQGERYKLKRIDGLTTEEILESAKKQFGKLGEKRFVEDLVEVLAGMGHMPGQVVSLELEDLESHETVQISAVPMTRENRQKVYGNYNPYGEPVNRGSDDAADRPNSNLNRDAQRELIQALINKFDQAARAGEESVVVKCLNEERSPDQLSSYIKSAQKFAEMKIDVSKLKMIEVVPTSGTAFAATDFFPFDAKGGGAHCVVYNLNWVDGGWRIHDIDLEDLEGYSKEFVRFVNSAREDLPRLR